MVIEIGKLLPQSATQSLGHHCGAGAVFKREVGILVREGILAHAPLTLLELVRLLSWGY